MDIADRLKSQSVGYYRYHDVILGKGNFATVYLARHKIIGCEVALKVINTDHIEEEYVFQNLEREAYILKDLHHTNIIRLYETIKSDNLYCLSLERIRGVTLYHYMMKQNNLRISEKLARIFFYQMLSAVRYMHQLQVIHRDLKLENILVEFGHVIKIIDFGLSNVYYPCVLLRTHCGSVEYAAPELFRSMSAYGLPADLWSLGVILYAMVVGGMPFPFNREKLQNGDSAHKREKFLERISKGLMQENWELMEGLTPDCWKLLHALLEPDQFRRMRIEDAINHQWITKDEHLKKRLPQSRKDLQRTFRPQIIEYLSDLLNASKIRIEMQINAGQRSNKIACMFYIIRDILVKEVLYPRKNFEMTFLYRFESWKAKRNSLFPIQRHTKEQERKSQENKKEEDFYSSAKSVLTKTETKQKSSLKIKPETKDVDDPKLYTHTKVKDSIKPEIICKEKSTRKVSSDIVVSTHFNVDPKVEKAEQQVHPKPYRSYKNSRPENIKNVSKNEAKQSSKDLKHDVKENISRKVYSSSHRERWMSREYKAEEKDSSKSQGESSTILTSETPKNQQKFTAYTKSRSKAPKSINTEERKPPLVNIKTKKNAAVNNVASDLKNFELQKQKIEVIKRILKNPTPREALPRHNTTQRPENIPNWTENSIKVRTEIPSRIPVKDMRYGPPAPFSQPVNSDKTTKLRRAMVADRLNNCRGDTNGKIEQK